MLPSSSSSRRGNLGLESGEESPLPPFTVGSAVDGCVLFVSRYRLQPAAAQEAALVGHCAHARYVWNLAVDQHSNWRGGRASAPGYNAQARHLTEARAASEWLRAGSQTVQQQA